MGTILRGNPSVLAFSYERVRIYCAWYRRVLSGWFKAICGRLQLGEKAKRQWYVDVVWNVWIVSGIGGSRTLPCRKKSKVKIYRKTYYRAAEYQRKRNHRKRYKKSNHNRTNVYGGSRKKRVARNDYQIKRGIKLWVEPHKERRGATWKLKVLMFPGTMEILTGQK